MQESFNNDITFTHHFLQRAASLNIGLLQAMEVIATGKMKRLEGKFLSFRYQGIEVVICPVRHMAVTISKDEQSINNPKYKKPLELSDYEFAMCA